MHPWVDFAARSKFGKFRGPVDVMIYVVAVQYCVLTSPDIIILITITLLRDLT